MMRLRSISLGASSCLVLVLAACGNGAPASSNSGGGGGGAPAFAAVTSGAPATTVKQTDDLKFVPSSISVKAGSIVEWMNSGTTPHNVTFATGNVASSTMSGGDTFFVKFTTPGTYQYECTFHAPGMAGTVTVS